MTDQTIIFITAIGAVTILGSAYFIAQAYQAKNSIEETPGVHDLSDLKKDDRINFMGQKALSCANSRWSFLVRQELAKDYLETLKQRFPTLELSGPVSCDVPHHVIIRIHNPAVSSDSPSVSE